MAADPVTGLAAASAAAGGDGPAGLDVDRVTAWLGAHVPALTAPFEFSLIAGGHSNLTYLGRDHVGRRFVLRRPPLGHTLRTAHDVVREFRILSALEGSAVPVPRLHGLCEDVAVNEAPFYVMAFVNGHVLRAPSDVERAFRATDLRQIAMSLVEVLVAIHSTDPDAVGLGELGRRDGYLERQLRRWWMQYESVQTRDQPVIGEVHRRLLASRPKQPPSAIVHGDYRLENVILSHDGHVAAVLDWELCTLGDPLADLGWLLAWWLQPGEDGSHLIGRTPTEVDGFPRREELIDAYVAGTGLDASGIDYYVAFAYWRLACIGEGVYARYRDGKMGARPDVPLDRLSRQVTLLGERALRTLGG